MMPLTEAIHFLHNNIAWFLSPNTGMTVSISYSIFMYPAISPNI